VGKKDKGEKGRSKKGKSPASDPAHVVLGALVLGKVDGVAAVCRDARLPLGEVLRTLLDLQRFGLAEVANGVPRPTLLGESTWRALAVPGEMAERREDAEGKAR
jgi:hypothetical protein